MNETCVVFALAREAMYFRRGYHWEPVDAAPCPAWLCSAHDPILMVHTGCGPEAARAAGQWLVARRPQRVIVAGFCGALVPGLSAGQSVRIREALSLTGYCHSLGAIGYRLLSVDRIVPTRQEKAALHAATGADVVDMETATLLDELLPSATPIVAIRAVSDDWQTALPPGLSKVLTGARSSVGRAVFALATRPWWLGHFLRLGSATRRAALALARELAQII